MRVNTVKYLTQYFSNNYSRYLEEEYDNDLYSDCLYTIDRINSFVQEILRISVESNKEYIDRVQKDNTNLWITSVFITIMVVVVSGSINILFSKYIAKIIESTAKMTKEIANGQRTAIYEIKDEPPEVKDMLESFNENFFSSERLILNLCNDRQDHWITLCLLPNVITKLVFDLRLDPCPVCDITF